jgi:hypothetical protein
MNVTITIPVNEEVASLYGAASEQEKLKLQIMLRLWLTHQLSNRRTLEQIMDDMSQQAAANGLTPEVSCAPKDMAIYKRLLLGLRGKFLLNDFSPTSPISPALLLRR